MFGKEGIRSSLGYTSYIRDTQSEAKLKESDSCALWCLFHYRSYVIRPNIFQNPTVRSSIGAESPAPGSDTRWWTCVTTLGHGGFAFWIKCERSSDASRES